MRTLNSTIDCTYTRALALEYWDDAFALYHHEMLDDVYAPDFDEKSFYLQKRLDEAQQRMSEVNIFRGSPWN